MENAQLIAAAQASLAWQRQSLDLLEAELDAEFADAARVIAHASKVVTTGIGKSGFIARKMAATLTSVRIPSVYLHPVDALHGDLGLLGSTDVLVAFSKSGETSEVVHIARLVRDLGMPVIVITSRRETSMQEIASHSLYAPVVHELDAHNILPTTSTTQAMVLADLLSVAAANVHGNIVERLQRSHPQGSIGSALLRTVEDVMHGGDHLPHVSDSAHISNAVEVLTRTSMGIVCVLRDDGSLLGVVTDGDIRRLMASRPNPMTVPVADVMTQNPTVVSTRDTLHAALQLMERRDRQISAVPVVADGRCVGVVRVHDIVRAQW